ncbi:MAG: hypothetical protein RCG16_05595 [Rickettsia hoogstraalii]
MTEYFNNILEQKNTPNLTILEECNILMKLRNINIKEILTPNTSFISKYEYKDIIAWLSNNTRSIFNEILVKPNSGLAEFIQVTALDFSNYPFITEDIQYIANYLRNNKTIERVFLDNCGINDKQVKILAEIFRLNKTITKLSLVSNKAITNIGIKTLLEIKHNNQHKLVELKISPNFNDNSEFQLVSEIDILNENSVNAYLKKTKARNLDSEIENKNLQPLKNYHELERPFIKNGNKLLKLIAESHNEITKTGNIINKLIVMVGMNGVGATTLSCF